MSHCLRPSQCRRKSTRKSTVEIYGRNRVDGTTSGSRGLNHCRKFATYRTLLRDFHQRGIAVWLRAPGGGQSYLHKKMRKSCGTVCTPTRQDHVSPP